LGLGAWDLRPLLAISFIALFATTASAQGLGYAEAGLAGVSGFFGRSSNSFHVGGGGEVVAADRVGIGGEFGFFNRLIVGSASATLHLGGVSGARLSPFLTGGYSRLGIGDGDGAFSSVNVGAGIHYWASDHAGLRIEFRDHFRPDDRGTTQYWSFRAGVAFR
jgi:hypothetical protein